MKNSIKQTVTLLLALLFTLTNVHCVAAPNMENNATAGQFTTTHQTVADSVNQFAIDLYNQLAQQEADNLLFSPYSIATALTMTYAGAQGNTKTQMAKTLYFRTTSEADIHQSLTALNQALVATTTSDTYQLHIANTLWGQQQEAINQSFLDTLKTAYGTPLELVNFKTEPEKSRQTINAAIEESTAHKIKDLLSPNAISSDTKLVLTNALYFKGSWQLPFDVSETKFLPFTVSPQVPPINVPMMEVTGTFNYFADQTMQTIELPYVKNLAMVILLPNKDVKLASINLREWLRKLNASSRTKTTVAKVLLPKFKVESAFELKKPLQALQMVDAFTPGQADFSAINGKKDLVLSAVVHKTFVDVNEAGTEAAAATAVVVARSLTNESAVTFQADHPFIFLIRDKRSGAILFLGHVVEPRL